MSREPYYAGWDAQKAGRPHNPNNSRNWKDGYRQARLDTLDKNDWRDDDAWMIDPDMEAQG